MRIPRDAIIPEEKLTRYLLVARVVEDKSAYLARAGFTLSNTDELRRSILELSCATDATADGANEYGEFWRVEGEFGNTLRVVLVWTRRANDGRFWFVTLKPAPQHESGGG